jgi:TolB-like protein/Tfp pilus assembly protein PilF
MTERDSSYRFGEFFLQPEEHRLIRNGEEINLRPKSYQLLHYLVRNHGHLASKNNLFDALWKDIYVSETTLRQCVSEIREALGDLGSSPQYIKTIPKVGYQFIAKVIEISTDVPRPTGATATVSQSIAVLPFRDMSPEKDQDYFCEGISEEIINALTNLENLRVVARTSAFSFKKGTEDIRKIGQLLNANVILEGSVRTSQGRYRISVQLIDASSGYHIWSEQYDQAKEDIFGVQGEIATQVVEKLNVEETNQRKAGILKRQTDNLDAYHLCLKGRYYMSREGRRELQTAIDFFRKAIDSDPDYAQAYAELATCYNFLWIWDYSPATQPLMEGKHCAEKAWELDNGLGVTHHALAITRLWFDWDWRESLRLFSSSIKLSPGYLYAHTGYAWCCAVIGRMEEAINASKMTLKLDPLAPQMYTRLGMIYLRAGLPEEALMVFKKSLELSPELPQAHWFLGQALVLLSRFEEGLSAIQRALNLSGHNPMILAGLGWAYGMAGENEEASKVLEVLERRSRLEHMSFYLFGKVCCGMGDTKRALEYLESAYDERDRKIIFLKTDETLARLRSESRFKELLKKIGLPPD